MKGTNKSNVDHAVDMNALDNLVSSPLRSLLLFIFEQLGVPEWMRPALERQVARAAKYLTRESPLFCVRLHELRTEGKEATDRIADLMLSHGLTVTAAVLKKLAADGQFVPEAIDPIAGQGKQISEAEMGEVYQNLDGEISRYAREICRDVISAECPDLSPLCQKALEDDVYKEYPRLSGNMFFSAIMESLPYTRESSSHRLQIAKGFLAKLIPPVAAHVVKRESLTPAVPREFFAELTRDEVALRLAAAFEDREPCTVEKVLRQMQPVPAFQTPVIDLETL